ncbi:MAG: hypothetical protein J6A22_08770, partial [Bacteroidales bacterium]|nr:hypothetical protein [Bacteroidales bacterium]
IFDSTELLNMDSVTRSKVLDKMTTERDLRNQIRYLKETAIAEGIAEGLAEGREKGLAEGLAEGREKGLAEGREKGLAEGREKGLAEGREKGLAEGRSEGRHAKAVEIALKLISNGMSKEEASEFVGIDVQDLDKAE